MNRLGCRRGIYAIGNVVRAAWEVDILRRTGVSSRHSGVETQLQSTVCVAPRTTRQQSSRRQRDLKLKSRSCH